jgi:hypothetical protein
MSKPILRFMLQHVEDTDVKKVVQHAYNMSEKQITELESVFKQEQYAIPTGFSDQDVDLNAPWLFTDVFCLTYVNHMARVGNALYVSYLNMSYREDIFDMLSKYVEDSKQLLTKALKTSLKKGINARHPYIEVPKETELIESKKYFNGLNPFSEKRPLNAIEISHLYLNILTNSIGVKLCIAFAQTSPTKKVQDYMLRLRDVSKKHVQLFSKVLLNENIEAPHIPDVAVSDSTTKTFSDKLMMFHMSMLMSAGTGNYATAGALSQRIDLSVNYERLSKEVARLAKSGADLMIEHNWLEQPPGIKNRDHLARKKG